MSGEGAQSTSEWPNWTPAVEGCEEEGQWLIRMALPGVDPKDVEIALLNDQLTIKGHRKQTGQVKQDSYFARELTYGRFERSFTLPDGVDAAKVNARYANGILEVRIPKPVAEAPRKVAIAAETEASPAKAA